MPYKSKAQQGFFHSPAAKKAGITPAQVAEFDKATKKAGGYGDLPGKAKHDEKHPKSGKMAGQKPDGGKG